MLVNTKASLREASPVLTVEPLVGGEKVVELLNVSQSWQEEQHSAIYRRKLGRLI